MRPWTKRRTSNFWWRAGPTGSLTEDGIVTIDEIKGVYMDLERLDRAGGGAYGPGHVLRIFLLLRPGIWTVCGCSLPTVILRQRRSAGSMTDRSREELEAWFPVVIHEYCEVGQIPLPPRAAPGRVHQGPGVSLSLPGGTAGTGGVRLPDHCQPEEVLFIQAPTGIGKTLVHRFSRGQGHGRGAWRTSCFI